MSQFNAPAPAGDILKLSDIDGHYVLVKPLSFEEQVPTAFGAADAVKVNVADLTTGEHHLGVLWFPKVVVGSLRASIGQPGYVLAKVGRGTAKPGQDAPWVLTDATGETEVVAAAERWLTANPRVLDVGASGVPAVASGLAPSLAPSDLA